MVNKFFYTEAHSSNKGKSVSSENDLSRIPDNFSAKIAKRERSEMKTKRFSKGKHLGNRVL
jgi:hypothetical protein